MRKVGLTGGIGSGKSTVSNMLKEKNIPIIDADIISREVLEIYPKIIKDIKTTFGARFVDKEGNLKRREFGNYLFNNEKYRKQLESIIIPYIKKEIFYRIHKCEESNEKICVVDAPTLIEHSLHEIMDINILVWVTKDMQIERVKLRDNLKDQQVLNRINSQMSLDNKRKEVDFVIDNSFDLAHTKEQLEKILAKIERF